MTHTLVPVPLPIRLQCLCAPMFWQVDSGDVGPVFLPTKDKNRQPFSYDPWEKRNELFRLKEGDNEGALELLNGTGFFDMPDPAIHLANSLLMEEGPNRPFPHHVFNVDFLQGIDGWHGVRPGASVPFPAHIFWEFRRSMLEEMNPKVSAGFAQHDYAVRFAGLLRLGPSAVITAVTLKDAVMASIRIDQLRGAKFDQTCKRQDCNNPMAVIGPRKRKYCCWECGHLVSVRKARAKERRKRGAK